MDRPTISTIVSSPVSPERVDEVRLAVPAEAGYAQVARLTVTAVATRIGFSYDEIEDLRIAVGEICSLLVVDEPGGRLTLRCTASDHAVVIEAAREPAEPAVQIGELSEQILHAVVDHVDADPHNARLTVTKRLQG